MRRSEWTAFGGALALLATSGGIPLAGWAAGASFCHNRNQKTPQREERRSAHGQALDGKRACGYLSTRVWQRP